MGWVSERLESRGIALSYDRVGNRVSNEIWEDEYTTCTETTSSSRTEEYGYDELNRLTDVDCGDEQTQKYTFDAMGNRTSDQANQQQNYWYDNANRLTRRNTQEYDYDANGNTLDGGGRDQMYWDSQNRLTHCRHNSVESAFTYGADGLRRSMTVGGTTTKFILDGQSVVREMRGSTVHATYLLGPRGVEYRQDGPTGAIKWYIYDGLGSVVAEVDNDGSLSGKKSYDVYGGVHSSSGTSTTKHGFVGKLGHSTEGDIGGLIYMGARYMDPVVGRFISQDPAENGANWHNYCDGNPVGCVDPNGKNKRDVIEDLLTIAGAILTSKLFAGCFLAACSAVDRR